MYHGCISCYVRYGIVIWGSTAHINRLFILQKRAIRIIFDLKYRQSCRGVFKVNNLLTLPAIYIYEILVFTFKNRHQLANHLLRHDYVTRFKDNYCYPIHRLTLTESGTRYTCIKMFNNLPQHVKVIASPTTFKSTVFGLLCQLEPYCVADFLNM